MNFFNPKADIFIPDGTPVETALARTTHLCIAAHQDDIETMAYHGIAECFGSRDKAFTGIVVTNGAGSPRSGVYGDFTDIAMQAIRCREQRKAAFIGNYAAQIQLAYTSAAAKDPSNAAVQSDLTAILAACSPHVVYLHQPADKHDTHVAVLSHAMRALRAMPPAQRPARVLGCECWRDLDWLNDADKQTLDVGAYPNLAASLIGVFDSQITGGKRYDLAIAGRRQANATFAASHATDEFRAVTWAIDLTPLVHDPQLSVADYIRRFIARFQDDVVTRLEKYF